jgi:hypothetical protein
MMPTPTILSGDRLTIYLNDHLAGAAFGRELALRMLSANAPTEFAPFLRELAVEVKQDRKAAEALRERLGVPRDRLKATGGWLAEKAGRFKLNDSLHGYSPLSRLLEVEALMSGVQAKLSLWRSLRELAAVDVRLDEAELDRLIARAESQLERLASAHSSAARLGLVDSRIGGLTSPRRS